MRNRVKEFFKEARAEERHLNRLFEEYKQKVIAENKENHLDDFVFFTNCNEYETDDAFGTEKKIVDGKQQVWLSNCWVNSNKMPSNVEIRDNRFAVKCVSYWFTPYTHLTRWNKSLTAEEVFEKAEKEKVLYEDFDVKISMVRRNLIPCMHTCQWSHKISKHEYVMYVRMKKKPTAKQQAKLDELHQKAHETKDDEERRKILCKIHDINNKLCYWNEVLHNNTLKGLENEALYYFNDWYQYDSSDW